MVNFDLTSCKNMSYSEWKQKYNPMEKLFSLDELLEGKFANEYVWTVVEYKTYFSISSSVFLFSPNIRGYYITENPKTDEWVLGIIEKEDVSANPSEYKRIL